MSKLRLIAWALCALASSAWIFVARAQSQPDDVAPFLASVRAEGQAAARRALGELGDLPRYDLTIELSDDLRSFTLAEELSFENTTGEVLSEVVLRVYANRGERHPVRFAGARCAELPCTASWQPTGVLALRLAQPLAQGTRLAVHVELRGALPEIAPGRTNALAQAMEGMSRMQAGGPAGDYGLLAYGDSVASLTRFYAVPARRRDGDWVRQEPSGMGDVAPERVCHLRARIRTAPNVVVASSGSVVEEHTSLAHDGEPARHELTVVAGLIRDFALLASPRFRVATRRVGEVELRSFFLQGEDTAGAKVLDIAAEAMRVYEARFGAYPYRDLALVEAPLVGGAGGVEYSGLVTVASMFYRSLGGTGQTGGLGALLGMLTGGGGDASSSILGPMLEFVTAHEVSHQWWSGLVGSDAREHPFVDESLAQYSAALVMEARYGRERAERELRRQVAQNYQMMRLQGEADGVVDRPAREFGSELAYAGLVYGKGPFFYREARRVLGDHTFFAALRRYVAQNAFRVATPERLRDAFARGRHRRQLARLFTRYFHQTHGDEDLGAADQAELFTQWLGDGAGGASPELTRLLQMMGGQGGPAQASPEDAARAAQALREAARMLEQLDSAGGP